MKISRRSALIGAAILPGTAAAFYWAYSSFARKVPPEVTISTSGEKRLVRSNGLPTHATGDFPNSHDPIPIRSQKLHLEMPLKPEWAPNPVSLGMWLFGVGLNGVPFEPSGPFWNGDGNSGWQFEVLHPANAVALGIDANLAHTQGRGMYHYHGLPKGLLWDLTVALPDQPMYQLGFAADGFPIYGPDCPGDPTSLKSKPKRLRSSYKLRSGSRRGSDLGPRGRHDGAFVEDFEYIPGHGDLDECNGRTGPTPEFPEGTYYYVLTDEFPFIPRHFRGQPDPSFRHGPPPGVSPPLPPELRKYQPKA